MAREATPMKKLLLSATFLAALPWQPLPLHANDDETSTAKKKVHHLEVYCFITTRRNYPEDTYVTCTPTQEACKRIANKPLRGVKPNPPFECASSKLDYETPY
jgi:hypothetical protein